MAAFEETLPFEFGPPFIDKPHTSCSVKSLLEANQPQEARAPHSRKALARTPERTAALVGLMKAAAGHWSEAGNARLSARVSGEAAACSMRRRGWSRVWSYWSASSIRRSEPGGLPRSRSAPARFRSPCRSVRRHVSS